VTRFHITLFVLLAFTAVALSCAVWIGLRRPPQADPFFQPFGDMPGFTSEQLRAMSARAMQNAARDSRRRSFVTREISQPADRLAVRTEDDGGRLVPSGPASICNALRGDDV
jgi:hypothetical protein